jgi:Zn-dependent protease
MNQLSSKLFIYVIIIFSAIIHEYFHAWAAYIQGDKTAKEQGRLTLNPIPHIDPLGTIIIPLILLITAGGFIGWAKPVPFNPYNLKNQKWGRTIVALAGPFSNLFIALALGLLIRISIFPLLIIPFSLIAYVNIFLALFNLIPIPPLDGSKLVFDIFPKWENVFKRSSWGIILAIFIGITVLPYLVSWIFFIFTGTPA